MFIIIFGLPARWRFSGFRHRWESTTDLQTTHIYIHQHQQKDYPLILFFFFAQFLLLLTGFFFHYHWPHQKRVCANKPKWERESVCVEKILLVIGFSCFGCVVFSHVLIKKVICPKNVAVVLFGSRLHTANNAPAINHIVFNANHFLVFFWLLPPPHSLPNIRTHAFYRSAGFCFGLSHLAATRVCIYLTISLLIGLNRYFEHLRVIHEMRFCELLDWCWFLFCFKWKHSRCCCWENAAKCILRAFTLRLIFLSDLFFFVAVAFQFKLNYCNCILCVQVGKNATENFNNKIFFQLIE